MPLVYAGVSVMMSMYGLYIMHSTLKIRCADMCKAEVTLCSDM